MTAPDLAAPLASEWRKFWALPTNRAVLAVTAAVTVGASALIVAFGALGDVARVQQEGRYDVIFFGATLGVWAYVFLGADFTAVERRAGLADLTYTATPRRSRVLLAKLAVVAAVGLVTGALVSLATVAITQGALALSGLPTLDLADPALWRAVLLYIAVGMAVQGVLGALVAVLVRHAAGALVIVVLASALPVLLAPFLGEAYARTVPRWVPGALTESIAGVSVPGSPGYLPLPLALLGVALWIGGLGALALRRLR